MNDSERTAQEKLAAEHVAIGAAAIEERSRQLGRVLSVPERRWLLRGIFVHRFGEVLGEAVAGEVEGQLPADPSEDGTGVRRR